MPAAPVITRTAPGEWTNHHGTVKVPIKARITVRNGSAQSSMTGMRETAAALQAIIGEAVTAGTRLRATGSRWSFSEVAVADDGWAVETDNLDMYFTVGPNSVDPAYRGTAEELILVQCGRSIARINMVLEGSGIGRALRTSGASNGQTIAGALGTGTHGSAVDIGALESQVAGIQLLTAGSNLWLERPSDPVMNAAFAAKLGATMTRDDLLFRAALVSLGALGIVHAVLLRTTGRYLLRSSLKRMPTSAVARAMNTLDFTGVPLPDPSRRPYFFQAVVEPSDPSLAYVTIRYKEPCPPGRPFDASLVSGYEAGNDLPGVVAKLLEVAPALRPALIGLMIKSELSEFSNRLRSPGETYNYTSSRSGVAGSALAVPIAYTGLALAKAQAAFRDHPGAPVVNACRFAQRSPALMGFTRFAPNCIIDMDGVDNTATRELMEETRSRLDRAGIPYTQHWGKLHGLTRERVRRAFGSDVDRWNAARHTLLPDATQRAVFSSDLLDAIGLND